MPLPVTARRFSLTLGKIFLSLLFFVLLLEGALRIYNPFGFRLRGQTVVLAKHERREIRNKRFNKLDPLIHQTRNSLGLRGEEPSADFAARPKLLTVGGSTTECFYLSDGHTWTDRLAERLHADFPRWWVNNAGLDGHSTYGHALFMRDYLIPTIHPDVIVFLLGSNDVGRSDISGYDQSTQPNSRSLLSHSELFYVLQNIRRVLLTHRMKLGHTQVDLKTLPTVTLSELAIQKGVAEHAQWREGFGQRIRRLIQLSRENGITPILMTQPLLAGFGRDPVTGVALDTIQTTDAGENGALKWRIMESYNDVTRRVSREKNVPLIDLAHELPKDSRYFYDLQHFTNEGAEVVGKIVYGHLRTYLPATLNRSKR